MVKIDALSKRLIKLLQDDARRSGDALAKELGVSSATVRRRVRALIKDDVMRIQAVLAPDKVGLPLAVVIAFDVAHDKLDSVMEFLADRPEVKWLSSCTGRFDIMAVAWFGSTEELSEFVQKQLIKLEGVRDSETFVCLQVKKPRYTSWV